ncbi:MAG: AAA-like domain-containing protein [Acidobacteria bacterium]|nr:AAA-like domain-containing protein [Acidobacteriota bacterium]
MSTNTPAPFYVIGGTLQRNAPSYVPRQADRDLYEWLAEGKFCYVLTSRQMGKSSLMVRTAARLREEGAAVAVLDLTAVGQNLSAEQWYDGLLSRTGQQLDLEDELEDFWAEQERLGAMQRWMRAIREVVLARYKGRVVIFLDEIDAVRSLPFSTDEFFAGIREFYNRRTEDPELERLTFCLLGVATPSDLIRDTRTTPFNIGRRVELRDFDEREAAPLAEGFGRGAEVGRALIKRVLYWTGGHPYLTQRLCQAVAEDAGVSSAAGVDKICEEMFLSSRARERDDNLLFVRERILRSEADRAALLDLYAKVRGGKRVADDDADRVVGVLRLAGIVAADGGRLRVRNRIYGHVFDGAWIVANMPDAELLRQRAAYRRGALRAGAVAAVILVLVAGLAIIAVQGRNRAVEEARRADRNARDREQALADLRTALATAERERENADQQKQFAEEQRAEAERLQVIAQEKSRQAVEQQRIAAAGRREAEEARARALASQKMAEGQRLIASDRAAEAERQRHRAEEQTKLATSTLFKVTRFLDESNEKERAVEYYDQLAHIYHEVGDRGNEVETLLTTGGLYVKLKEEGKADEYFTRAQGVYRDAGEAAEVGNTLTKIGDLYKTSGDGQKANGYYERSLELLRRALPGLRAGADRKKEAYAFYYTSLAYQALGDTRNALDFCNRALPLFRSLRDDVMADVVGTRIEELSQSLKDKE